MVSVVEAFIQRYPLISDQIDHAELRVILEELVVSLEQCPGGAAVEFGCYVGTTSLFIQRVIDQQGKETHFYVYDSFAGLPDKTDHDLSPAGEQFRAGELTATKKQFELQFKKAGLKLPVIKKGWFSELTPADLPDRISFAYLDGDYYASIRDSLRLVWPRLMAGAVVVVDDYANEALPGAAIAVDEWLSNHPADIRTQASLAIVRPLRHG